ncbi:MAG: hypothetical protein ACOC9N_03495 [Gemmatimonadota bacterium]
MIDLIRLSVTASLIGVAVGGVAGCDAEGADADARPASGAATAANGPRETGDTATEAGAWATRTESGALVRLRAEETPLRPGPIRFLVELPSEAADPSSLSADLVSPTMPMHGIRRFPVERTDAGEYVAEVEIPMEGEWMLYVNLDVGTDAAGFEFTVPAADTTGAHDMHGGHEH